VIYVSCSPSWYIIAPIENGSNADSGNIRGDEDDNFNSVRRTIDLLLDHDAHDWYDLQGDHQVPPTSPPESVLSLLTEEQFSIASEIIEAVLHQTD
jgi:hypothetical protein